MVDVFSIPQRSPEDLRHHQAVLWYGAVRGRVGMSLMPSHQDVAPLILPLLAALFDRRQLAGIGHLAPMRLAQAFCDGLSLTAGESALLWAAFAEQSRHHGSPLALPPPVQVAEAEGRERTIATLDGAQLRAGQSAVGTGSSPVLLAQTAFPRWLTAPNLGATHAPDCSTTQQ